MFGIYRTCSASYKSSLVYVGLRNVCGKSRVNGADIAYEKVGTGKKALLLLPGAMGCGATDFGPQIQGLNREKFTIVAWDPRGYGKSIPPDRDFPVDFFNRDASDAAQLMENLGFKAFSLLGWSDGGNTACIIAGKHKDRVQKLVIWGANSYVTKEELELFEGIRDVSSWSERMRKPMIDIYGEEYFRKTWSSWVDGFIKIYNERKGDVCKEELKQITCPTLIIHGMKDRLVPLFHPESFHRNIKNSTLDYWEDGKHNLHLKYSERFNAQVEEFLLAE